MCSMSRCTLTLLCALLTICQVICQGFAKKPCTGVTAKVGDTVHVHYEGFIDKSSTSGQIGKMFDSSLKRGKPFKFQLGGGQVIRGWDEGIVGMCLGEKTDLIIPPERGYGSRGAGDVIPPFATLRFSINVVGINDAHAHPK